VPLYTEQDLDRVHPYRGETGVLSVPAVAPARPAPLGVAKRRRAESEDEQQETQEFYWRRESARHRQKMARLSRTAAGLRRQIDERQRQQREAGSRRRLGATVASLKGRLDDIEAEIQAAEAEFEERSRRAGALPGWLR
jgi:chromosome segregation ATPase